MEEYLAKRRNNAGKEYYQIFFSKENDSKNLFVIKVNNYVEKN